MRPRAIAIAALVASVAATSACVPGQRTVGRLPPRSKEKHLQLTAVPTVEPPLYETLPRARWLFVTTAPKIDEPLPERLAKDAPAVVSHIIDATDGEQISPKDLAELRRLAFGRKAPPHGHSVRVPAKELAQEGWDPPAPAIWLIGPEGTCRASIGDGFVGTYDDRTVIEIAWEVIGCPPSEWAQAGLVVDMLPRELRWVPAQTLVSSERDHGKRWTHALADDVPTPTVPEGQRAPQRDIVRVRAVPGTTPMATQILSAWQWWLEPTILPHDGEPIDELSTRCVEQELRAQVRGVWGEDGFTAFADEPFGASFPVLVGAFVEGEAVQALLWRAGTEGVVTMPIPLEGGGSGWAEARLRLGSWQPEPAATWDWGMGPRCGK